jgi:hypothetical protein
MAGNESKLAGGAHWGAPRPSGLYAAAGGQNAFQRSQHERAVAKRAADGQLTVAQAFGELWTALEPSTPERETASAQQKRVREKLDALLTLDDTYLTGSYRRRTLIRPVDDIDVLLVLNWDAYKSIIALDAAGATTALNLVEAALRTAYPTSEIVRFGRCIRIQFAGTGIGFDAVPAFRFTADEFVIPDEDRNGWLTTNPREVERLVSEANSGRTEGWLVPEVKLLKAWKDARPKAERDLLHGYLLEVKTYHALQGPPTNERIGMAELFEHFAAAVWNTTPDIWPQGEAPDSYLTLGQRLTAATLFSTAGQEARRAVNAENEGRTADAHAIWRALFGERYPESGAAKDEAKSMSFTEAARAVAAGSYITANSRGLSHAAHGLTGARSSTSHGGIVDDTLVHASPVGDASTADNAVGASENVRQLEWQIDAALRQFTDLERVDPATAAADPALWPVRPGDEHRLYAVLVGRQRTVFGSHRILVTVPWDAPAIEPRVYRLNQHVRHAPRGAGHFAPVRRLRHQWSDGAMCTHAQRDRWDGRLVTLLVYAADWLFRQDYYQLTGVWLGREIGSDGRSRVNGRRPGAPRSRGRAARRRR